MEEIRKFVYIFLIILSIILIALLGAVGHQIDFDDMGIQSVIGVICFNVFYLLFENRVSFSAKLFFTGILQAEMLYLIFVFSGFIIVQLPLLIFFCLITLYQINIWKNKS